MNFSKNDESDMFAAVRQSGRFWPVAGVLAVLILTAFAAGAAVGCDTPVYRYAMYNWSAAPYSVFFFHDPRFGGSDPHADGQAQEVDRLLLDLSTSDRPLNVNLIEVDVLDQANIDRLPDAVKESLRRWRQQSDSKKPGGFHLLFSPWGRELFAGRLDADTVRAMAESPARRRLCELLQEGNIVAVCLTAKTDANRRPAAEAVEALLDTLPDTLPEVELLEVSASDPKEAWFVKNLMLAEPDLEEYAGETMVFMAYGRGRTMLPCIGKGVTAENLARCVSFLKGDCSCQMKADNPGIDLLARWDWPAAVDVMAADDDEGAPVPDGQLFYHEFDPGELPGGQNELSDTKLPDGQAPVSREAEVANESIAPRPDESFAVRQVWYLGGGLAVVVVVIVISGFFVMRRN